MDSAKIRLSAKEMTLINNAEWILTKNEILNKAVSLLAHVQTLQVTQIKALAPSVLPAWSSAVPKIAKGENYLGLPYRLLDYPAIFSKKDIAAIRTFMWWGNGFSVTLHLSGSYKLQLQAKIIAHIAHLQANDVYICINDDEWQHHFDISNYKPLNTYSKMEAASIIGTARFIKLAVKMPLSIWPMAEEKLLQAFTLFTKIIVD
ncbi:MAG: hypothetical protein RIR12_1487 [Bacteroidota bacterium]|jgi:hypothetical protein